MIMGDKDDSNKEYLTGVVTPTIKIGKREIKDLDTYITCQASITKKKEDD